MPPNFDLRPCSLADVQPLFKAYHGFGGTGGVATYVFAVFEGTRIVAAYVWQPPSSAPRRTRAQPRVAPSSRTDAEANRPYALPRTGHILTSLLGIQATCSGWVPTDRAKRRTFTGQDGKRMSSHNPQASVSHLTSRGYAWFQRWEHWICPKGRALEWMLAAGWRHVAIKGKVWRSGKPAHRWVKG